MIFTSLVPDVTLFLPLVSLQQFFDKPLRLPSAFVRLRDELEVQVVKIFLKILIGLAKLNIGRVLS